MNAENELADLIALYTSGPVSNFRARDLVRERADDLQRLIDTIINEAPTTYGEELRRNPGGNGDFG